MIFVIKLRLHEGRYSSAIIWLCLWLSLFFISRKRDKSYSEDPYFLCRKTFRNGIELRQGLYLSMRKLLNLSRSVTFWQFFPQCFLFVCPFFRRRRPMNITGAVARDPRFHHIKIVLCWTLLSTPFQATIARSYRAVMFVLHIDTFKARAIFAPRSPAVKNSV